MPTNNHLLELQRYQGSLLGLAVADAIGTTVEFKEPGSFEPVTDMVGGGIFRLDPGQWTDDTSMALCLAQSLIECNGFDAIDQMDKYIKWWDEGYMSSNGTCFDLGVTIMTALTSFKSFRNPYSGSDSIFSAGNGSLMRLAPVPLYYAQNPRQAMIRCADSSRTTHGATTCIDACRYYGGMIIGAVQGRSKEEILSNKFSPVRNLWDKAPLCEEIYEVAKGSFKLKEPPDIIGSGYVVESMEAALWAFYKTDNFKDGCLLAVNLGNDADTTAAIYGQLAGAYYGIDGIPRHWRERVTDSRMIVDIATGLYLHKAIDAPRST
jgi:ADP-ribosylglycohydrolase